MIIREFKPSDINDIIKILKLNNQYTFPEVDGPEAMKRVASCPSAIFLICESEGKVVGVIRGTYDGSRAMIHQLSVHPAHRRRGIGKALVKEIVERFQKMGAPTVSATIIEESLPFWEKIGFKRKHAFLAWNW